MRHIRIEGSCSRERLRAAAMALQFALDYCIDMGFHDATVDFGERGRAVIDRAGQANLWWTFTAKVTTALAALGQPEEAEVLHGGLRKTVSGSTVGMDAAELADTAWHGGLLLGRDREIATLTHALDRVRDGSALVVEILGEPGMGKTRLLVELADLAQAAGVRTVACGGGGHARALDSALVEVLDVQLAGLASQLLAGLPAHRHPSALRTLLGRLASVPPLVLAVDDAHNADEQALDLICELLHWPPSAPLLLVLALRPHQTPTRLRQALDGASGVYRLPLAALTVAETAALAGLPATQAAELALHGNSNGNPFYVKALATLPPPYRPNGVSTACGLPHQVGAAVAVEIGTLSPDARLAAHAAAVLGDPVDPCLVAEVAELSANHIYRAIDELVDRDILRPAPDSQCLTFRHPVFRRLVYQDSRPGWRLRAHGLADQALRGRDAPAMTRAAHLAHTTSEEAVWVLADAAEAVASHQPELAARWLLAALRQASTGAVTVQERATLLRRLCGVVSRARFGPDRSEILHEALRLLPDRPSSLRLTVYACSAQLEWLMRRPAQARRVARAGMAEIRGDHLTDKQTVAALALELACAYLSHRFATQSQTHAGYALAAAREHGDRALQTCATGVAAVARCLAGESSDANDEVGQAAQAVDVLTDSELSQRLDAALWVGVGHVLLDRPEEALRHLDRAVEIGTGAEVHITSLYLHFCRVMALRSVGRLADATAAALAAHDLAASSGSAEFLALTVALRSYLSSWTDDDHESGDRPDVAWLPPEVVAVAADVAGLDLFATFELGMRAETRLAVGDHDGCVKLLLRPEGPDPSQVDPWSRVAWYELLTRAALLARRYEDADRWAGLAESVAARLGSGGRIGLGALARAQALTPRAPAAAAALARQAAESLTASGLALDAARARAVVGVALAGSGKIDRAIEELAVAENLFSHYGARRSERKVAEQRRRMDTRIRSGSVRNGVAALTARELQVATLVTEALTNRQVAARLFVTVKTVEMHLSHVFVKLGISNRAGLVREMALAGACFSREALNHSGHY